MGKNAEKLADMYGEFLDIEINEIIAESEKDPHRFSERFESRMNEMIYSGEAARKNRKSTGAKRSRIIWIIAAAILVLAATACAVPSIRESIAGFFVRIFSDHVEYSDPDITKNSIEEEYGLVPIPEGFEEDRILRTDTNIHTTYQDEDGNTIILEQSANSRSQIDVDSEVGSFDEHTIEDGTVVRLYISDASMQASWVKDGYFFSITYLSPLDTDTFISWIESVGVK